MPVRGKHQLQVTPAEMLTLLAGLNALEKERTLSPIEKALIKSTREHLERSKVYN